jgi:hypothetical protein
VISAILAVSTAGAIWLLGGALAAIHQVGPVARRRVAKPELEAGAQAAAGTTLPSAGTL